MSTIKAKIKSKNPIIAFVLCIFIVGLGNYFYIGTPEQKKVGRNYFLGAVTCFILVFLTYLIFNIPENSKLDKTISSISNSIGVSLSIVTGISAYKAAKKLNEENI